VKVFKVNCSTVNYYLWALYHSTSILYLSFCKICR